MGDDGFMEVTREEFFATVGRLNVHPHNNNPYYSDWETPSRTLLGRTYPGWKNPGNEKRYLVRATTGAPS